MSKQPDVFDLIAQEHGVSREHVVMSIQASIDDAWSHPEPGMEQLHDLLFPEGRPDPATFVSRLALFSGQLGELSGGGF